MKRTACLVTVALGFGLGCDGVGSTEQPHQTMREIFENVVVLLPASVDAENFAHPGSRDAIAERALGLLVKRTASPYGGLDGPNLPDATRTQLQELRALIDANTTGS